MPALPATNVWLMVSRAEDVPDQWVAHCLDLDIVTQGNSFKHAIEMAFEAIAIVLLDEIEAGRNPLLRRAPQEDWERLYAFMRDARNEATPGLLEDGDVDAAAVMLEMKLARDDAAPRMPLALTRPHHESRAVAESMPARFADLVRALRALGVDVLEPRSGSHYRAVRNGVTFPIPAHNGLKAQVADVYIKKVCRCFELDETELRRLL